MDRDQSYNHQLVKISLPDASDLAAGFLLISISATESYLGWGKFLRTSHPAEGETSFYLPDFFLAEQTPWWTPQNLTIQPREAIYKHFLELFRANAEGCFHPAWSSPDRSSFDARYAAIKQAITEGIFEKVVITSSLDAHGAPTFGEVCGLISRALEAALMNEELAGEELKPLFIPYALYQPEDGTVGLSPELLIEFATANGATTLRSTALGGTAWRGEGAANLLQDSKNAHEHDLVVNFLNEQLRQFGQLQRSTRSTALFSNLLHLRTDFSVTTSAPIPSLEGLVSLLHPTPAMGCSPKNSQANSFLAALDPQRGSFGAPWGLQTPWGFGMAVCAIRNLSWQRGITTLRAGSGIVAESIANEEWDEINHKREATAALLGFNL